MKSRALVAFFSHAGANSTSWSDVLPYWERYQILCVERPGRGVRRCDVIPADLGDLIADQAKLVSEHSAGKEIILVGHSFGGGLAWLVARGLVNSGKSVQRLIISAAPPIDSFYRNPAEILGDDSLLDSLIRSGGINRTIIRNQAMRNIILQQLKQDYRWKAQFKDHSNGILDIPSAVVTPRGDSFLSVDQSAKWADLIPNSRFIEVPGDHFAPLSDKVLVPSNMEAWFSDEN